MPFLRFIEKLADPIIVTDDDNTIIKINKKATELFGYNPADVIGNNISMLFYYKSSTITSIVSIFNKNGSVSDVKMSIHELNSYKIYLMKKPLKIYDGCI